MSDFLKDYDFSYPQHLVAQQPLAQRSESKMMVVDPVERTWAHHQFKELHQFLRSGDLIVVNDTQVRPCRFFAKKPSGGRVQILLLKEESGGVWEALVSPMRGMTGGTRLEIIDRNRGSASGLYFEVVTREADRARLRWVQSGDSLANFWQWGEMPLPPYISREQVDHRDEARYQTVYAKKPGAAAAPTAGFHFTEQVFQKLAGTGIGLCSVTLHVGLGTFQPLRTERLSEHRMHEESYEIPARTQKRIQECHDKGGRVFAVGTSALRALETFAHTTKLSGQTGLFIKPGYEPRLVQGLITNFHQPQSTLIMLVAALVGRSFIFNCYQEAINQSYRLFSYGDCMLIRRFLPGP